MTQVPAKYVVWLIAIIIGIGFLLGILYWNKTPYKCFDGKRPYGDWVTIGSVGRLDLRVKAYGCVKSDRYDPKQFKRLY